MRSRFTLRRTRAIRSIVAAGSLAVPGSAIALTSSGRADRSHRSKVQLHAGADRIGFGRATTLLGRAPAADGGTRAVLQASPRGSLAWRQVATALIDRHGRFRFRVHPARSARYRALVAVPAPALTPAAPTLAPLASPSSPIPAAAFGSVATSPARTIDVLGRFALRRSRLEVLGHGRIHLAGRLLPALRGRLVRLQRHTGSGWHTLARDRTSSRGGFRLGYRAAGAGHQRLRLVFGGDLLIARSVRDAGAVTVLQPSTASWYYDAGATACGFHATYGVANRTLPCGTRVSFRDGSRTVTAVVDDRGPFVAGREWDLSQSTAAALGFSGVGTVWAASW